jgi:hypothetical protein
VTLQEHRLGETPVVHEPYQARRRSWSWQQAVQVGWVAFALLLLVIFVVTVPTIFQGARITCDRSDVGSCPIYQFTPAYVQILRQLHIPVGLAQGSLGTLCVALSVVYWLLGLLIFWRKSREPIGLIVSLALVMFGATGVLGFNLPEQSPTLFQLLAEVICYGLMWPVIMMLFFTFPTGRFIPRWTLAAFVPFFVVTMIGSIPATMALLPPALLILTAFFPIGVQVYRYTRLSNAVEQQQTKWFVFTLTIIFVLIIIQGIFQVLSPDSTVAAAGYQLFNGPFWLVVWTLVFVGVSIPVLRYRLWDIDVIINRTLVYGSVTGLLGALYVGLVLGLESLAGLFGLARSDNPVALVISTLVIAVLIRPLRNRIQSLIDSRFYRKKYDVAQTVAAFGASLGQDTDLEQIREQLLAVVNETMQPEHVWLHLTARYVHSAELPHYRELQELPSTGYGDGKGTVELAQPEP